MKVTINGQVAAQFEPVRTAFKHLWQNSELGAGLCVYHHGQKVVDLWGGWTDRENLLNNKGTGRAGSRYFMR